MTPGRWQQRTEWPSRSTSPEGKSEPKGKRLGPSSFMEEAGRRK
jgi:hypothetical protein